MLVALVAVFYGGHHRAESLNLLSIPPAEAEDDCADPLNCATGFAQAALTVRHLTGQASVSNVIPTDLANEVWTVTSHYFTESGDPNCTTCESTSTACTVTIRRNGNVFQLVNTTCAAVTLLTTFDCTVGGNTSAHSYKFGVAMADEVAYEGCTGGTTVANLGRVEFSIGTPPNGKVISTECAPGADVSPVYSSYSTNDSGAFECRPDTPFGPEIALTYS